MTTPIEDLAAWNLHRQAEADARAAGLCDDCARRAGFAATDVPPSAPPAPCARCARAQKNNAGNGPRQPKTRGRT